MALTLTSEATDSIGLEEIMEALKRDVDFRDQQSIAKSAHLLRRLGNNRTFVTDFINKELVSWRTFQLGNQYTPQTFMLGMGAEFSLRMNIWAPRSESEAFHDIEERLIAFHLPHDHNFSFMTLGYFGKGYNTDIYEYATSDQGERTLQLTEQTSLPEGKIMFYRAFEDVHEQSFAEDWSLSINILINTIEQLKRPQSFFKHGDINGPRTQRNMPDEERASLCQIAGRIGNGETTNLLEAIAVTHYIPQVRAAAAEALVLREKDHFESVRKLIQKDEADLVRKIVLSEIKPTQSNAAGKLSLVR